ncbi:hypothetical protein O181_073654 [Austropuccinia psidii MF-1]|uniref:Reverse transcriptase Ty1/copia-type domain-containing protein n=1 Tax=Austropuccinia psidii MF-1 TaxID=1389203 RepID=A0A9Q3F747_9BASI|nr:hypothetical protein [Austropuccinia psidii MF-1]
MRADALLSLADITPQTFKGELQSPEKDSWMASIDKELSSMDNLIVWEVIEQQDSYQLFRTTWVFEIKINHLNKMTGYIAQLCAQGFTQTQRIDFEKTYTPTGNLSSLQTSISFTASKNLTFHQINIQSEFLNAPLP